jgi:hypothetical protein
MYDMQPFLVSKEGRMHLMGRNMKRIILLVAFLLDTAPALARFGTTLPFVIEEAPIDRAIVNVTADKQLSAVQRERVLGRLHLIAYAQGRVQVKHYGNGEWTTQLCDIRNPDSAVFCTGKVPGRELPQSVGPVNAEELAHLRLARTHYTLAVALDGRVLRARLGLAYVLDELSLDAPARLQLREIIAIALPRLQQAQRYLTYSDDYAVLSEAVEHLGDLAVSESDRTSITHVRTVLSVMPRPSIRVTPIVVPLVDAPFAELIDATSSTAFDFSGIGDRRADGWLTRNAAWLVWDPKQRGKVRSGFDLIGQRSWGVFWSDGFEALRALDDDGDSELTGSELSGLALWHDADGDGVSDVGEVQALSAHGVIGLSTRGAAERPGLIVAPGGVRLKSGEDRPLYDWTPGLNTAPAVAANTAR